jgi:hypothetical protein
MPAIKDPEKEARRVAAVRAAILKAKPWEKSKEAVARISPEGMRRRGQNPQSHGADSTAFKLAGRYAHGVLEALGKVGQ